MLLQISIGTVLLVANIIIATISAIVLEELMLRTHPWLLRPPHRPKLILLLVGVTLWLLAVSYTHLDVYKRQPVAHAHRAHPADEFLGRRRHVGQG